MSRSSPDERCLAGLGVDGLVVVDVDPCAEGAVEDLEGDSVLGAHLGFKAVLDGPEQPLDQPARGGISRRPVTKADMEPVAGGLETIGMVDLGVVEIEPREAPRAWRERAGGSR
jgi:hypothetical protein